MSVRGGNGYGGGNYKVVPAGAAGLCRQNSALQPVDRRVARDGLHDLGGAAPAAGRPLPPRAARRCGEPLHRRDQEHDGRQDRKSGAAARAHDPRGCGTHRAARRQHPRAAVHRLAAGARVARDVPAFFSLHGAYVQDQRRELFKVRPICKLHEQHDRRVYRGNRGHQGLWPCGRQL